MLILIAGIALWIGAHAFKRFAPDRRAALGDKGKGLVALGVLGGLVLMIIGYRSAPFIGIWSPPEFFTHLNNLLMLLAVVLLAMSVSKGRMSGKMRHPMLTAVKTWALAHLLVNGDLASIVLFGAMLGWAVWTVIAINKAETWEKPVITDTDRDWRFLLASVGFFAVMTAGHLVLGVYPFGGEG